MKKNFINGLQKKAKLNFVSKKKLLPKNESCRKFPVVRRLSRDPNKGSNKLRPREGLTQRSRTKLRRLKEELSVKLCWPMLLPTVPPSTIRVWSCWTTFKVNFKLISFCCMFQYCCSIFFFFRMLQVSKAKPGKATWQCLKASTREGGGKKRTATPNDFNKRHPWRTETSGKKTIYINLFSLYLTNSNFQNFKQKSNYVSVKDHFPMGSQEEIYDFLDDSDGLYQARCNGFFDYLFLIRTGDYKTFRNALLGHLFTKEYQESHHWPSIL